MIAASSCRIERPVVGVHPSDAVPRVAVLPMTEFTLSPSIQTPDRAGAPPAYEVKFLLTQHQAEQVEARLKSCLIADPHSEQSPTGGYATTTLYCDTPGFDVYHRRGRFARRKLRLRRYGQGDVVFLEQKAKHGTRVKKRRATVAVSELARLQDAVDPVCLAAESLDPVNVANRVDPVESPVEWAGGWFHQRVQAWNWQPVLTVMYDRRAFVGVCDEGPLRLTFDRSIRGQPTHTWDVEPFPGGEPILADRVVCEFKFRGALPTPFKSVISELQLTPTGVSKYRLCLTAAGISFPAETDHV